MTKKEQARYRSVARQLHTLRKKGWTADTHPDVEILERELATLGDKFIAATVNS